MTGTESIGAPTKASVSRPRAVGTQIGAARHRTVRIVVPLADEEIRQVRCKQEVDLPNPSNCMYKDM